MDRDPLAETGDEELVARAQHGDTKAFEVLVERYKRRAYRIAFHFSRDREEAKDLSQEAFLRAFAHLKGFDLRARFYTWFYRILVNLCLDHRSREDKIFCEPLDDKAEHALERDDPANPASSLDGTVLAGEISRRIARALDDLPSQQRTAFLLRNHKDLSMRETAEVMGITEGTAKVHLHRAVLALRKRLADLI